MENESFKVGDVVVLKSGSETMTIESLTNTDKCKLIYWDSTQKTIKTFDFILTATLNKASTI